MFGNSPLEGATRWSVERTIGKTPRSFLDGSPPAFDGLDAEKVAIQDLAQHCARWRRKLESGEINIVVPEVSGYVESVYRAHLSGRNETESNSAQEAHSVLHKHSGCRGRIGKVEGHIVTTTEHDRQNE